MSRPDPQVPDGVLLTDKPKGWTSSDVVRRVKALVRPMKVGHTGTLDPMATGLLLLALGEATKLSRWLTGGPKRYRARVRLGLATDTLDAQGRPVARAEVPPLEREELERVLQDFRGCIEQTPPMYSALHHRGQRLYTLARRGIEVTRPVRRVEIGSLQLLEIGFDYLDLDIACSAGTYIRSLAADIGERLGTRAHLASLERTEASGFHLTRAISAESLDRKTVISRALRLEQVLARFERVDVPSDLADRLANGHQLRGEDLARLGIESSDQERILWFCPSEGTPIALVKLLPSGNRPPAELLRVLKPRSRKNIDKNAAPA